MHRKVYFLNFLLLSVLACLVAVSCEKQSAQIPSYIKIDSINLEATYSTEGTASHKITDAWVYVNSQLLGAFELPATIPVLKEGAQEITIRPGIKKNGSSHSRDYYFFYTEYVNMHELLPEETIEINPTVSYKQNIVFAWMEDFESAGTSFLYHNQSDTVVKKTTDKELVFEGNASGIIELENGDDFFEWISPALTDVPDGGQVFMEINYKTTHDLTTGLYINSRTEQFSNSVIVAQDQWNKIYLDYTDLAAQHLGTPNYNIFMGFTKTSDGNATVLIDNIKILHFEN